MSKVVYFNITYNCNSKCVFCFSNSTGLSNGNISFEEIKRRIKLMKLSKDDLIVINGGEPTCHPNFYEIINMIISETSALIKVYTNAIKLDARNLNSLDRLSFVIPIHGNSETHCEITCVPGSYEKTLNNIKLLEKSKIDYAIKFIINSQMINCDFSIIEFLKENGLSPKEIIIARLNNTDKAKKNRVDIPLMEEVVRYFTNQMVALKNLKIKFLDIPFCFLSVNENNFLFQQEIPEFYFNDINWIMRKRNYYKNVNIGNRCDYCFWNEKCQLLKNTYLTVVFDKNRWMLVRE